MKMGIDPINTFYKTAEEITKNKVFSYGKELEKNLEEFKKITEFERENEYFQYHLLREFIYDNILNKGETTCIDDSLYRFEHKTIIPIKISDKLKPYICNCENSIKFFIIVNFNMFCLPRKPFLSGKLITDLYDPDFTDVDFKGGKFITRLPNLLHKPLQDILFSEELHLRNTNIIG